MEEVQLVDRFRRICQFRRIENMLFINLHMVNKVTVAIIFAKHASIKLCSDFQEN